MITWLRVYPCYSASTHALLTLRQQTLTKSSSRPTDGELQHQQLQLQRQQSLLAQGWAAVLLLSIRWTGIESIEQMPGLGFQGIFTGHGRYGATKNDNKELKLSKTSSNSKKQQQSSTEILSSAEESNTEDKQRSANKEAEEEEEEEESRGQRPTKKARHNYIDQTNNTSAIAWRQVLCDGFYKILDTDIIGAVPLTIPWTWQQMAESLTVQSNESLQTPPIILITGAKNMGKSTFSRYLVNMLLNSYPEIAYLDGDLGQPEFTPSGFVSLHRITEPILGPPYTHLRIPYRSAFLGRVSPKDDPDDYMEAINCMIQVYRKEIAQHAVGADGWAREQGIPLVVNTHGWIKGMGLDLLIQQFNLLQPTHAGHLSPDMRFPISLPSDINTQIIHLDTAETALYATSISRQYYFKRTLWTREPLWAFDTPLTTRPPWSVPWSSVEIRLLAIDNPVPMSEVLWALNGTLVALMTPVNDETRSIATHTTEYTPEQDSATTTATFEPEGSSQFINYNPELGIVSPYRYTCLGLGLVRAIDPERRKYYLLAPYTHKQLSKVQLLVRGAIELPICCTIDGGARRTVLSDVADRNGITVPYVKFGTPEGAGAVAWRVRRNILRKRHDTPVKPK
ncbi:hypothetical protein BDF19DRAFT_433744 [Syncephalis fuscata]|nr:hypothetical protein BDF19DRAFT_433744 [Syncephalis fuscata]